MQQRQFNLLSLLLILSLLISTLYSCGQRENAVYFPNETPTLDSAYARGVSGAIAGVLLDDEHNKEYLILAGGANFPNKPASEGGQKVYYNQIYAYDLSSSNSKWTQIGVLPEANAYAGFIVHNNALYLVGGSSPKGASDRAYQIKIKANKAFIKELPHLPYKSSGAKLLHLKDRFYLLGGTENGTISNKMLSLKEGATKWQEEKPYPAEAFIKTVAVSNQESIYLWGAFNKSLSRGNELSVNNSFFIYNREKAIWEERSYINGQDGMIEQMPCFGGGMAYYNDKSDEIVFLGGVNKEHFLPALKRVEAINKAKKEDNQELLSKYKEEVRDYLEQAIKWHAFNQKAYSYDLKDNALDYFYQKGKAKESFARADACLVQHRDKFLIIGGELKPGIRTRQISMHNQ